LDPEYCYRKQRSEDEFCNKREFHMKQKALVVDNHPVVLKFMSNLLEREGYQVITAHDGISTLSILRSFKPDVIFLDLVMPNISGDKLCRIIRRNPALRQVHIVILSAIAAEERVDFVDMGADACIAKGPFNKMGEHVLAVLNNLGQAGSTMLNKKIIGLEDIYERQVTKELVASKKHSDVILNNMSEGILELNGNAKIIYANPAAVSLIDIVEEDLLGRDFTDLFQGNFRRRVENLLDMNEEMPGSTTENYPWELGDKKVLVEVIPVRDAENRLCVVILKDITERMRLENHLRHAQKMEAIGTLAGGIAHQFNNALFAIIGNTELLQMKSPGNENIKTYLSAVKAPLDRMTGLTDQLLAYAQDGNHQSTAVSIQKLVLDTVSLVQHTTDPRVRIETDLPAEVLNVEVDIAQMQMAISAILSNAAEAIEGKGRIKISAGNGIVRKEFEKIHLESDLDRFVYLRVEDDGKGMDRKTKDRIFEPFFTTKFQGRGLGMAAVYGLVRRHGGYLDVASEENQGTTVSVYLPLTEKQEQRGMKSIQKMVEGNGTILVVDDEEMVLSLGSEIVKMMGYDVLEAKNGGEAVEIYRENKDKVDMVILDMAMPDMNGGEAYHRMKEIDPEVKVLLTSGYGIEGQAGEIMKHGCDAFIQKPFSISNLSGKIREVLEQG
jgi:PAS domain S-box-containing protein